MSVYYSVTSPKSEFNVWCETCADTFVSNLTGIARGYSLDGVSTKLIMVEGVEFEVAPYGFLARNCGNCGNKNKAVI